MPPVLAVVGYKNSGKTTLVVGLVSELTRRGYRVMTVKHGHAFELDTEGTDSWRHRHEGGAERVVMAGPQDLAVMGRWGPEGEPTLLELVGRFLGDADIVIAEGFKRAAVPKIEIHRAAVRGERVFDSDEVGVDGYLALVTDGADPGGLPVLDPDDPELAGLLADLVERALL